MKTLKTYLFAIPVIGFLAAVGTASADPGKTLPATEIQTNKPATPAELTATNCLICHGNMEAGKPMLAPPFMMVKMHYQSLDKETFIKTVSAWVKAPDQVKSRMPGAVNRFGLMPPLPYSDADLAAIAEYVYETDFSKPGFGIGKGKGAAQGQCCGACAMGAPAKVKGAEAGAKGCAKCAADKAAAPKGGKGCAKCAADQAAAPKGGKGCAKCAADQAAAPKGGKACAKCAMGKAAEPKAAEGGKRCAKCANGKPSETASPK